MRRTLSWVVACLVAVTGSIVAVAVPAAAADPYVGIVAIRSRHMNKLVSAELGFTGSLEGMLRARADGIGRWETFTIDKVPNTSYYLIASNARVSGDDYSNLNKSLIRAELNYPGGDDGMLRAMGSPNDGYQTAEQFQITSVGGGYVTIKNRSTGKYLKAESGYAGQRDGMIRAAGNDPASWTTHFRFE